MNAQQIQQISQIVALAVAQVMGQPAQQPKAAKPVCRQAKKQAKPAYQPKSDRKAAFANAVVAAFKAKGIDVTPNQDVFTYGKWAELGLQPKAGEKAIHVKTSGMNGSGIPLFHKGQVEALRNPA